MRKQRGTLEEARNKIKRDYKRGPRTESKVTNPDTWNATELAVRKEAACFYKAAGFSHTYIGDALNTTRSIIGHWFEDPDMQHRVREIHEDIVNGAVKLLKTYSIEIIETLMQIARTTEDEALAVKTLQDLADRVGISKVSRMESATTQTNLQQVEITDPHGLIGALKEADPMVQQRAAEHMDELLALAAEHTEMNVTHGDA